MDHEKRQVDEEELEAHSLPGTNQAGKGPGPCEKTDQEQSDIEKPEQPERTKPDTKN